MSSIPQFATHALRSIDQAVGQAAGGARARLAAAGVTLLPTDEPRLISRTALTLQRLQTVQARVDAAGGRAVLTPARGASETLTEYMRRLETAAMRGNLELDGVATGRESDYEINALYEARETLRSTQGADALANASSQRQATENVEAYLNRIAESVQSRSVASAILLRTMNSKLKAQFQVVEGGVYSVSADEAPSASSPVADTVTRPRR